MCAVFVVGRERKRFKAMLNCLAIQDHDNARICILLFHDKWVMAH